MATNNIAHLGYIPYSLSSTPQQLSCDYYSLSKYIKAHVKITIIGLVINSNSTIYINYVMQVSPITLNI